MDQPTLFESKAESEKIEEILLFALGEFQSRGFALAERELPLDRLLGAFKRSVEHYQVSDMTDEQIAENLEKLGAKIKRLPGFVAKHPFRVTVSNSLAERAVNFFEGEKI
jgi:hypothetical protein